MQFFRIAKRVIRWCRAEYLVRKDSVAYARSLGVKIGERTIICSTERSIFGSEPFLVSLGKGCALSEGVRFVTHDGGPYLMREQFPDLDIVAPISVGDNVYIGLRATVLPGVTIGSNCIIGAGAVVSRNIPANSVAVGVPARVIGTVDDYKQRALLKAHSIPGKEKERLLRERFAA